MNKKNSDLTKDFVETSFDIIKDEIREENMVISYSKLRDIIVNQDIKDLIIKNKISLNSAGDVVESINEEYKSFIIKETVCEVIIEFDWALGVICFDLKLVQIIICSPFINKIFKFVFKILMIFLRYDL